MPDDYLLEFVSGNFLYRIGMSGDRVFVMNLLAPPLSFRETMILPKPVSRPSVVVLEKTAYLVDGGNEGHPATLFYSHLEFSGELNWFRIYPQPLPVKLTYASVLLESHKLVIQGVSEKGEVVTVEGGLDSDDWLVGFD